MVAVAVVVVVVVVVVIALFAWPQVYSIAKAYII